MILFAGLTFLAGSVLAIFVATSPGPSADHDKTSDADNQPVLRHYRTVRKLVGGLGVGLPFIVAIGAAIHPGTGLQRTISHYYDTSMRNVFVGILFAIGVFLFSYKGYDTTIGPWRFKPFADDLAGNLACFFALGVALFPTTSDTGWVRTVHSVAAIAMFLTLAYFCLRLFRMGTFPDISKSRSKWRRDWTYRVCGYVILGCIGAIVLYSWQLSDTGLSSIKPVFWLEAAALIAFGVSWFVKGVAWKDNDKPETASTAK